MKLRASRPRRLAARGRAFWRAIVSRFSSSLTRRIVLLNLGGLVALLLGFLYLNQFRAGLIDAQVQSLQTQGEIIAAAIAASATVDTDAITIDPEKLQQLAPGESEQTDNSSLEFSINPETIGPVLNLLVSPTQTRARIFDRDGFLVVDSATRARYNSISRSNLPALGADAPTIAERWTAWARGLFGAAPPAVSALFSSANGRAIPEVVRALSGASQSVVRLNPRGETIISVAVPVQRFRVVRGALLLSTQGGAIDVIIASERWAILRVFVVAAAVMLVLSLALAGAIAEPMRRLAEAAERVRRGIKSRQEIPDYTRRIDEIGHLSGALRDMTRALYNRIEAIESFAADVAHELKNPLTSLRSAVETLPLARSDESRGRLLSVIQHDVRRLDRLISDISDASRLDAELARADPAPVDLAALLRAVTTMANHVERPDAVRVMLDLAPGEALLASGHDSRLAQVFNNLIDNARSFSPPGGSVRVALRPASGTTKNGPRDGFEIIVDDDGPGIPDHALERIFERFYTDRPNHGFGQNSGLGLSISRQIVEAHHGSISAANRLAPGSEPSRRLGARFTVWLPVHA